MLTHVTGTADCSGCVCALQTQSTLCVLQYIIYTYVHVLHCVLFYYLLCSLKANFYVTHRQ